MPAVFREVDAATCTYSLNLVATIDVNTHLRLQGLAMKYKNNEAMPLTLRIIKHHLILAAFRTTLEGGMRSTIILLHCIT